MILFIRQPPGSIISIYSAFSKSIKALPDECSFRFTFELDMLASLL